MAPQACTGQPSIWAFDSTSGLCVAYKTGFCQANANKFYTKAECDEYCGVEKDGKKTSEEMQPCRTETQKHVAYTAHSNLN